MDQAIAISQSETWREINQRVVRLLFFISILLLPFSTHMMNKVLMVGVGLTLLSGQWREKGRILRAYRATLWVLIFFAVAFLGVLYSAGTFKPVINGFARYSKILYFIAFLPFLTSKKFRDLVLDGFIVSVFISMVIIVGHFFEEPFVNAIDSSFLVGFCNFLVLRKFFEEGKWRWVYGVLFVIISSYLLLYNIERTGYVMFFGGLATLFWQYYRWCGLLVGIVFLSSLLAGLYSLSPTFQSRINMAFHEANGYFSQDEQFSRTTREGNQLRSDPYAGYGSEIINHNISISLYEAYWENQGLLRIDQKKGFILPTGDIKSSSIGLRLGFAQYSWREIKKHPWLGNGTGSFIDVYRLGGGPTIEGNDLPHPHNEYISVWFQLGLVGLLVFLIWQAVLWLESFSLPKPEQFLLQGLLVCFALLGFCNASLTVNPSGDMFVLMSTLLLAAKLNPRERL